uniref:Uncharacterized protein n=1 Tax=Glossina pallidipes TaxID=7398 RepID=A0A1A9Z4Y3_GLOPL
MAWLALLSFVENDFSIVLSEIYIDESVVQNKRSQPINTTFMYHSIVQHVGKEKNNAQRLSSIHFVNFVNRDEGKKKKKMKIVVMFVMFISTIGDHYAQAMRESCATSLPSGLFTSVPSFFPRIMDTILACNKQLCLLKRHPLQATIEKLYDKILSSSLSVEGSSSHASK